MSLSAPVVDIQPAEFSRNPYPMLEHMREHAPVCFVPQLQAMLLTRHNDVVECEKNVAVFSSEQPGGLMNVLMGENMMRKDGAQHVKERRQAMPSFSPSAARHIWKQQFYHYTSEVIDSLKQTARCDLVQDFAMPVSAHALRCVTGLKNITPAELDACSQGIIDGISNYGGDQAIEDRCHRSTAKIDACIDQMLEPDSGLSDESLLSVLCKADQPIESIRANIKLAISGGQNEPRDAIAGCVWALLQHPHQLTDVLNGDISWRQVFQEYARWISPIGMSPRRVARSFTFKDIQFEAESRAFLMFGSANRDETVFADAARFDCHRDTSKSVSFGAGPHFCAGAAISRMLIAEVALPALFNAFPDIRLNGDVEFSGWAFRGPVTLPVHLGVG